MSPAITIACQVLIALGIFNVWILRRNRPTQFRPDGAAGIEDEFRRYGFPSWTWRAVGVTKVSLASLLLVGIALPAISPFAAGALALLMLVAIGAHLRVSDPPAKAMPALLMLALCTFVVISHSV
jgi:uncharacterized membrane protein YphA (DoxX/SURF4 family)